MIAQNEIIELEKYCSQFRSAIQFCKEKTSLFKKFPVGCCRDTSLLLSEYIKSFGFSDILYCSKQKDDCASHAWLEWKGITIDITADQFGTEFEPIILSREYLKDQYHLAFTKVECTLKISSMDVFNLISDFNIIKNVILNKSGE